jgi:hypothetical protein
MSECDECFICFESKETDKMGKLIHFHTEGCGCSHPVHEWCLVKWYVVYNKRQKECPFCKTPGDIHGICEIFQKFQNRFPVHSLLHNNDGTIMIYRTRRERYRSYIFMFIIIMGILLMFYACLNRPYEDDNTMPWDGHVMG